MPRRRGVSPAGCAGHADGETGGVSGPLMPFWAFLPFIAPNGAERQKQPIYASVSVLKPGKIPDQKMVNFSILQNRIFLFAYMGIFWSEATTVFSIKSCHMTRVLKTVSGRNFAHFQQISSGRKNAEFHLFSSGWKFWPAFALAAPGNGTQSRAKQNFLK